MILIMTPKDNNPRQLYKTTVVIWTDYDTTGVELDDLGYEAIKGDAYCSFCVCENVDEPQRDPHPPAEGFFVASADENERHDS